MSHGPAEDGAGGAARRPGAWAFGAGDGNRTGVASLEVVEARVSEWHDLGLVVTGRPRGAERRPPLWPVRGPASETTLRVPPDAYDVTSQGRGAGRLARGWHEHSPLALWNGVRYRRPHGGRRRRSRSRPRHCRRRADGPTSDHRGRSFGRVGSLHVAPRWELAATEAERRPVSRPRAGRRPEPNSFPAAPLIDPPVLPLVCIRRGPNRAACVVD